MNPTPEQIKTARSIAGLSQSASSKLVHVTIQAWQNWEYGKRQMPGAAWELYLIKTGQNDPEMS